MPSFSYKPMKDPTAIRKSSDKHVVMHMVPEADREPPQVLMNEITQYRATGNENGESRVLSLKMKMASRKRKMKMARTVNFNLNCS